MADLSGVSTNYFPTAHESFSDTLSSTITAGAATVPITNLSEYNDGDVVVLTVEPGTASEATFVGVKASTPYRVTNCVWTEGNTGVGHNSGSTVIDYDSATHYNLITKWLKLIANQDGTLKAQPIRDALGLAATSVNGWEVSSYTYAVASGYNKGNKEFDLTVANADVRSILSVGMKLRLQRGTTAPTQCTDLEASSSQYASRASGSLTGTISTMTDDFTAEAWIKPESYTAGAIISRYNGTSGWSFNMQANGKVALTGVNASAIDEIASYQSLLLGIWTHVAIALDMSGSTGAVYINGISVPTIYTNGAATAIAQAGDLQIGAVNGASFFDGKISDVRVWNVVRTALQIRDNMNQQLVGTETNLVGYWKLNGDFNDSTSSANNLSGSGGAVATNADNPMKDTEYAIITKLAYSAPNSTITVFTGTEHNIPNMSLTAPYYSVQASPYGFPSDSGKWRVEVAIKANRESTAVTAGTWYNHAEISIPTGAWNVGYEAQHGGYEPGITELEFSATLSTANNSESDSFFTTVNNIGGASGTIATRSNQSKERPLTLTAQTVYYFNQKSSVNADSLVLMGTNVPSTLFAECAYI